MESPEDKNLRFWIFYNPNHIGHDFYVEETGYGICTPKWRFTETRKNHLLQIVYDGIGTVCIGDGKPFTVQKGEAFFLPAGIPHWYESDAVFPTTRAWISWSGEYADFFTQKFNIKDNPYLLHVKDLNAVKKCFTTLRNSRDNADTSLLNIYSCFFEILANCIKATPPRKSTESRDKLLVNNITKYIDDNLATRLTVNSIAFYFGYHPSSLFRKFKNITGFSLKEYILHRKIALAKSLICETTLPIDEIILRCGYENQAALNALFIRHSYTTLAKYIKEQRDTEKNS